MADAFVQHTLAGDGKKASTYTIDVRETSTLRSFSRDAQELRLRIAGPTEIHGNRFEYPLRGTHEIPEELGGGRRAIEASLHVWMTFTSDRWLVSDWIYQKK